MDFPPSRMDVLHRIPNTLVHSWNEEGLVVSRKNTFYLIPDLSSPRLDYLGQIPWSWRQWPCHLRIIDRALKQGILQVHRSGSGFWLVANGHHLWRIDPNGKTTPVPRFSATRPMNRGICDGEGGYTYIAEYVSNRDRTIPIHVFRSRDLLHFEVAWEFESGQVRHVHALIPDLDGSRIWILTGDHDNESNIYYTDDAFSTLELFLNEGQRTRATDLLLTDEALIWGMDSPLEQSFILTANRGPSRVSRNLCPLPGPVYYSMRNAAGGLYLGTTVEPGPAVIDDCGRIFANCKAGKWSEIHCRRNDRSPQYGIFYFPKGTLPENYLVFSQRALRPDEGYLTIARDREWD